MNVKELKEKLTEAPDHYFVINGEELEVNFVLINHEAHVVKLFSEDENIPY